MAKTASDLISTANLADGCLRQGIALRAVSSLTPLIPGLRIQGRARPVRHFGSVDIFLEAVDGAAPGDILVIDNGGRADEGCIGDLTVLEAASAGLHAIILWGRHRDTAELARIGLPIFSLGSCPVGPTRLDARTPDAFVSARIGSELVTASDMVVADDDGILLIPADAFDAVERAAMSIHEVESAQAALIREGETLRRQLDLAGYLEGLSENPGLTFRDHLRRRGGAIEM